MPAGWLVVARGQVDGLGGGAEEMLAVQAAQPTSAAPAGRRGSWEWAGPPGQPLMTCPLPKARAPGAACQIVNWVLWTARAFHPPDGLGAGVAVPGGSTGSCRQGPAALLTVTA
jgi:hypothetical protein